MLRHRPLRGRILVEAFAAERQSLVSEDHALIEPTLPTRLYALAPDRRLFEAPGDDEWLWRYMNLGKLTSLLTTKKLYFTRADLLADRHEGSYGGLNAVRRVESAGAERAPHLIEQKRLYAEYCRRRTYLSCWHASGTESAAMWQLYGGGADAVAVAIRAGQLRRCLPDHVALRHVRYENLSTTFVSEGASTDQFFYKQRFFEHEREVRALVQFQPEIRSEDDLHAEWPGRGILVGEAKLVHSMDHVRVGPSAPQYFVEAVAEICRHFGVVWPVRRSEADAEPF